MKTPILCEWNVEAPWGIISLTSWGNKDAAPVFLVHGRQDCTDTFQSLLDLMPRDEYHYVGIDLPGSGMSTHMPVVTIPANITNNMTNAPGYSHEKVDTMNTLNEENMTLDTDSGPVQAYVGASATTNSHGLLAKASENNLLNQEQAAQEIAKEIWHNFTTFEKSQSSDLRLNKTSNADITLRFKNVENELDYDAKTDSVFIETGDRTENLETDENHDAKIGFDYTIIEVDPNGNLPACGNPNKNILLQNILSALNNERSLSEEKSSELDIDKEEEILDSNNVCHLKEGDEIFFENTRHAYRILLSGPLHSYCSKIFTKSSRIGSDWKRYRIDEKSAIKFVAIDQNSLRMQLDLTEKEDTTHASSDPSSLGIAKDFQGSSSVVPNNSPQNTEDENILPQLIPELEKMSIELEQCTKLFEKLTIPMETKRSQDHKNKKTAKSSIFPKFIKCNDHGVGGTCPFARNPASQSNEKPESPDIVLPGRAHGGIEYEIEINPVRRNRSSFGQHFGERLHASKPVTIQVKSQRSQGPDKFKRAPKISKFNPTFAVKILRARPRRILNGKRAKSCFCLCVAGTSEGRGPLDCFTDCFRSHRRRKASRKISAKLEPRARGNRVNSSRNQNPRDFPHLPMPGYPIHPFHHFPIPIMYDDNLVAEYYEEFVEEYEIPRPNPEHDDVWVDDENLYEGFYGEPIGFIAPMYGPMHMPMRDHTHGRVNHMPPEFGPDELDHHHHSIQFRNYLPVVPVIPGVKIMRFHYLGAIEVALKHLGWDKFIFMGHSMGCELGLFYSAIYPGKITKMILLDAEPTLRRLQVQDLAEYQATFYDNYYNNYAQENYHYKTYTKAQAIEALMKARNLTEDKASIIINKSLVHLRDDLYRFTWGHRLKFPAPQNYPNTYYFALFRNIPPCLLISALGSLNENTKYSPGSRELISMMETLKNFKHVVVEGDHDVHLSHPEKVAPYVNEFLRKNNILSSKL